MARGTDDAAEGALSMQTDAPVFIRWGAASLALALLGLVMAARAADDYHFVCGMAFTAFGLFLGTRLLARWRP